MNGATRNRAAVLAFAVFVGTGLTSTVVMAGTAASSDLDPTALSTIGKISDQFMNEFINLPIKFTEKTGAVATLFIRSGDDFERISTSLPKKDGTFAPFALGTLLGKSHPGYKQLLEGKSFSGKATLFGKNYITQYVPLKDLAGNTIAIFFVGTVEE
jgi:hypothetical protein